MGQMFGVRYLLTLATTAAAALSECDRTFLNDMSAAYIGAQTTGQPVLIPSLSSRLVYTEQFKPLSINAGILTKALNITSYRRFYDAVLCTAFVQLIITDPAHPYVIGTRFEADGLNITKMETLVTDAGDWLFNATGYQYYDSRENWALIPPEKRDSREVIKAAGDAYFDRFGNANASVPWGTPCARLEGGAYTGNGNLSANTCNLGLPSTIKVLDRR